MERRKNLNQIESELENYEIQEQYIHNPYQNVVEELKQSIEEADKQKSIPGPDDNFINLKGDPRFPSYNKLMMS